MTDELSPAGYGELLVLIKAEVRDSRLRAARAVNTELVNLYWRIGRRILDQQDQQGWGAKVIAHLSADLQSEFPGMTGMSASNLQYMRAFASRWPAEPISPQAVGKLPWVTSERCWTRSIPLMISNGTPPIQPRMVGPGRFWMAGVPDRDGLPYLV